mmetsp:Transcript_71892/g.114497  ORF Transcript_71892/g.114497 Transcript_71892/m.114497 type:complete len:233 (+) Transcript_71892:2507-3205(+)
MRETVEHNIGASEFGAKYQAFALCGKLREVGEIEVEIADISVVRLLELQRDHLVLFRVADHLQIAGHRERSIKLKVHAFKRQFAVYVVIQFVFDFACFLQPLSTEISDFFALINQHITEAIHAFHQQSTPICNLLVAFFHRFGLFGFMLFVTCVQKCSAKLIVITIRNQRDHMIDVHLVADSQETCLRSLHPLTLSFDSPVFAHSFALQPISRFQLDQSVVVFAQSTQCVVQ